MKPSYGFRAPCNQKRIPDRIPERERAGQSSILYRFPSKPKFPVPLRIGAPGCIWPSRRWTINQSASQPAQTTTSVLFGDCGALNFMIQIANRADGPGGRIGIQTQEAAASPAAAHVLIGV